MDRSKRRLGKSRSWKPSPKTEQYFQRLANRQERRLLREEARRRVQEREQSDDGAGPTR
jgi:hypothetical protein